MRPVLLWRSILRPFIEFVYPSVCLACQSPLSDTEHRVCARCWGTIRSLREDGGEFRGMMERFRASGLIEGLVASYLFEKEGALQSLIHELKYGGLSGIGVTLGEDLGNRIARAFRGVPITGVIPVPLHRVKKRERGYNQSEYICQGIARVTGLPVLTSVLKRTRYTKSQTQLNLTERVENVSNAFAVDRRRAAHIENTTLLLVDDVITTGATIISCAKALKDHGAHGVYACSLALAHKSELP